MNKNDLADMVLKEAIERLDEWTTSDYQKAMYDIAQFALKGSDDINMVKLLSEESAYAKGMRPVFLALMMYEKMPTAPDAGGSAQDQTAPAPAAPSPPIAGKAKTEADMTP